ncbi:hypothetical protein [Streptomyces sp. NPDC057910]|uniref:hypothetical protein n=1 Tax=Streptomyces sp. NPDC057910 TaxID=3346278 RepID=UPI0036EC490C
MRRHRGRRTAEVLSWTQETPGLPESRFPGEEAPVPAWEQEHDCCTVEQVHGWFGGTRVITTVHEAECPAWSAR